jgi:hypothetical protein
VELLFNTNLIGSNMTSYSNLGYTDESVIPNIWKGTPIISENINSRGPNPTVGGGDNFVCFSCS